MSDNTPVLSRPWPAGLLYGLAAAVANLIVFGITRAATGDTLVVPGWNGGSEQTVGPVPIIVASLLPAVLAVVFGLVLQRFMSAPRTTFLAVVIILALLSAFGPLGSGAEGATIAALTLMHLITGGLIGYGVARTLPGAGQREPARAAAHG